MYFFKNPPSKLLRIKFFKLKKIKSLINKMKSLWTRKGLLNHVRE
jgi:hypothetical protein